MALIRPATRPAGLLCRFPSGALRPVDPVFLPEEPLYRGFSSLDRANDRFPGVAFVFDKGCSLNRGKYAQPEDFLFDHPNLGIMEIKVATVPKQIPVEAGLYVFKLVHLPLETPFENYSHSEIQCCKDGSDQLIEPPKSVKKQFRSVIDDLLPNEALVLREPTDAHVGAFGESTRTATE